MASKPETADQNEVAENLLPAVAMKNTKKRYSEEDIENCLHALKCNKRLTVAEAARQFNIPASTVKDRKSGRCKLNGTLPGPKRLLNKEEEESLASYARYMINAGMGITYAVICSFALTILQSRDPDMEKVTTAPKRDWARKFMKRHELSCKSNYLQTPTSCEISLSEAMVKQYHEDLQNVCKKFNLLNSPENIYNVDETHFRLLEGYHTKMDKNGGLVPGEKQIYLSEITTVTACVNAAGGFLPLLLIFSDDLPDRLDDKLPKEMFYCHSETGCMCPVIFEQWFQQAFLPNCKASPTNPVLLLLDNASCHYSLAVIKAAIENNVQILCEPSLTSCSLQPLEKLFSILKDKFKQICHEQNLSTDIKWKMPCLVQEAMESSWSKAVVKSEFTRAGVVPLKTDTTNKQMPKPKKETLQSPSQIQSGSNTPSTMTATSDHAPWCPSAVPHMMLASSHPTNAVQYFTQCGYPLEPGWRFCPNCGMEIVTLQPTVSRNSVNKKENVSSSPLKPGADVVHKDIKKRKKCKRKKVIVTSSIMLSPTPPIPSTTTLHISPTAPAGPVNQRTRGRRINFAALASGKGKGTPPPPHTSTS